MGRGEKVVRTCRLVEGLRGAPRDEEGKTENYSEAIEEC